MSITLKTKVEKHAIKLPEWVQIPDGKEVEVRIETEINKEEKRRLATNLCGAWADDPSLDPIFKEIEKERHRYLGREVDLNAFA